MKGSSERKTENGISTPSSLSNQLLHKVYKCFRSFQVNPGEYILAFCDCAFVEYFPVGESRARGGFHHHRRRRPSLASLSPLLSTLSASSSSSSSSSFAVPMPSSAPSLAHFHWRRPRSLRPRGRGGGLDSGAVDKKTQGNKLLPHFPGSKLKVRKVGGGRDRLRSKRQDTTERGEGERKAAGTERERKGGRGAFNFGT